jgi:UDP-N-acetylmuramoyl-tripeptide--D-alanyl-D-alanine ligase
VIKLADLLDAVPGSRVLAVGPTADDGFTRASTDSRDITGGELFFAITGGPRDGHDFTAGAARSGARGMVVSRAVRPADGTTVITVPDTLDALQRCAAAVRRRSAAQVIAITGSAGKTTTKTMIAQALGADFQVLANRASYNNHLGVPLNLTGIDPGHSHVVAEIGTNHRGEIAHLAGLVAPDLAVITNVGYAHLGNFTDRAELAREKTDLLRATCPGGTWVLNGDDRLLTATAEDLPEAASAQIIRVGFGPDNHVRAVDVTVDEHGTRGTLRLTSPRPRQVPFALAASGRHFAYAAMLAVAVADRYGVDPAHAVRQLHTIPPPPGRASLHRHGPRLLVIDDSYNASPDATLSALDLLGSLPATVKIAAIGEMGELGKHSVELHRHVGAAAAAHATHLVTVGENTAPARAAAAAAGMPADRIHAATSAREAHAVVRALICAGSAAKAASVSGADGADGADPAGDTVVLTKGARFRHMERVALGLAGRTIGCDRALCSLYITCDTCPQLETTP